MRTVVIAGVALGCLSMMLSGCGRIERQTTKEFRGYMTVTLCEMITRPDEFPSWELSAASTVLRERGENCKGHKSNSSTLTIKQR